MPNPIIRQPKIQFSHWYIFPVTLFRKCAVIPLSASHQQSVPIKIPVIKAVP